jgi:hypothetical protein
VAVDDGAEGVGRGNARQQVRGDPRRRGEDQGVADMITFTGRADNRTICRFLSTTDVAVDPCPYSPHADVSTATKIMEYMFFRLPIVAFDLTETLRSAGENIDIYIGGVLCGSGEIVVIENSLGVRITDFRDD